MAIDASASANSEVKEGLGQIQDYYTIDASDQDLVKMINRKLESVGKDYEDFKKEGKRNEKYWSKPSAEIFAPRWHQSKIITNIIYMGVETMLPIITSKPAEPVISCADEHLEDEEQTKAFKDKLQDVIMDKYNDQDYPQQELFEMLARHLLLYKLGVPKIVWDDKLDDYLIEYVHPHKLFISSNGHYNSDVWVAEYMEKSLKKLLEMFPEKENDLLANLFPGSQVDLNEYGDTPVGFWEYWPEDGSYVVWKMQDVILQKKLNPYLKWTDDKKFDKLANHFDFPHKPYMFLNSQNLGRHIWDDTSPVSQTVPLQDGINLKQRIITDTSRDQGILVGAEEFIDRGELSKYTGAPDDKLTVKGGDPSRALYRVPPKQLQPFIQDNLLHLLNQADNIMGTHATTRGAKSGNQTLGQDMLAKESDYGRIDAIVRGIERLAAEIYNWEVQMMLVKYEPEHYARILGQEKGQKLYDEMQAYNQRGIKIVVKPGSTLPTDKISQRQEAIELAKMNRISNLDLFKRMDFPNPMEMAKNIYLQDNAPEQLYPDLAPIMQQKAQEAALQPPPPAPMPQQPIPEQMPPPAPMPPPQPMVEPPPPPPISPQGERGGTIHTQALLQGIEVPPFEGIDPSEYEMHMTAEFQFLATPEFLQLPEEIQTNYARHVLAEKNILQGGVQV